VENKIVTESSNQETNQISTVYQCNEIKAISK